MDKQELKNKNSNKTDKPLFLDFAVKIPEEVKLSKLNQFGESIRYDGPDAKSIDD